MATTYAEAAKRDSRYWKNKPVMKVNEKAQASSQIYSRDEANSFRKSEPSRLPVGYTWRTIYISDEEGMVRISDFLTTHFKRGTESDYIIRYDPDRLRWEMCNRGYYVTVEATNGEIAGVIGYTHRNMQVFEKQQLITEPMYICCQKKYRKTGIAKVLIDEVIRQSANLGIDQGVVCNNRVVSRPVARFRQYSRPLNYKKLREQDFVAVQGVDDDIAHNRTRINLMPNKKYVVAEKTEENIRTVHRLYNRYMESFNIHVVMGLNEIENYMFDERYVKTLLVFNDNNECVDFITYNFYDLINTTKTDDDNIIRVANILMYSSNTVRPDLLFINLLKQLAYDKIHIVYINDMMHSNEFILSNVKDADEDTDDEEENAFYDNMIAKTTKRTFLSMFNWRCASLKQNMASWLLF